MANTINNIPNAVRINPPPESRQTRPLPTDLPFGYVDVGVSEDDRVHFTALNVDEDSLVKTSDFTPDNPAVIFF